MLGNFGRGLLLGEMMRMFVVTAAVTCLDEPMPVSARLARGDVLDT